MVAIDPATIKVPDAAAWAAHDVFWNARFKGEPIDLELEFDKLFHYAVAAAIAAWPGAGLQTSGRITGSDASGEYLYALDRLILPVRELLSEEIIRLERDKWV